MKTLVLMRHAQAQPEIDPTGMTEDEWRALDHARDLEPAGHIAAEVMAGQIRDRIGTPDAVFASDAVRTRQTAEIVAAAVGFLESVTVEGEAYLASGPKLLELVGAIPESAATVVFVAHVPGLDQLIASLAGPGAAGTTLPRAGVAHLVLDVPEWSAAQAGTAQLLAVLTPPPAQDS